MRHGQVAQVTPRRFLGQRDVALDAEGERQADAVGRALAMPFDAAFCSDLARARETARRVLAHCSQGVAAPTPLLREIALGQWEGLTVAEVRERYPGEYGRRGADLPGYRPAGGESFADVQARAVRFLDSLAPLTGTVLAVAHGGFNRALLCHVTGRHLADLFSIPQEYCCVNVLDGSPAGWTARAVGLCLDGMA
ncbi:histidine phosphatase family protein [Pseudodesulfovibrio sp. F-1]|uniref:Histidine phosphatase family protein n=1 Tax=Pseudodesulfovibrio alkaliphilus TaxID=2661613 RepID=A0A7K1KKJ6_9BACT|nr:histidine phosphatase family protein [Pseudodesulfovibrio alkaliphilus]MUM76461.1 histidine phosphatase family protein [Pseudodesulfovibrio alkaliphilus]